MAVGLIILSVLAWSLGILLICGGWLMFWIWLDALRTHRLLAAPVVPVAKACAGDRVHLRGRVKVASADALRTPIGQREAVYYHVEVWGISDLSKRTSKQLWSQTRHCPFFLDDGSGQQAAVDPEGAIVLVDEEEISRNTATEFLRAQGVDDPWRPRRILARVLAKDAEVHVVGLAVRPAALASGGYRDPGGQPPLTLRRMGRRAPLILSTAADGKPRLVTSYHPAGSTPVFALVFVGLGLYMVLAFGLGLGR
jgi:hypothetical protein